MRYKGAYQLFVLCLFLTILSSVSVSASCPPGTTDPYCTSLDPQQYCWCDSSTGVTNCRYCSGTDVCDESAFSGWLRSSVCVGQYDGESCPPGTTDPYCTSLDPQQYCRCIPSTGVTSCSYCPTGTLCSSGDCVGDPSYCKSQGDSCFADSACCSGLVCSYFKCGLPDSGDGDGDGDLCPPGTTTKYCSEALDPTKMWACNPETGVTQTWDCEDGSVCKDFPIIGAKCVLSTGISGAAGQFLGTALGGVTGVLGESLGGALTGLFSGLSFGLGLSEVPWYVWLIVVLFAILVLLRVLGVI